jgi:hypothetical protein
LILKSWCKWVNHFVSEVYGKKIILLIRSMQQDI